MNEDPEIKNKDKIFMIEQETKQYVEEKKKNLKRWATNMFWNLMKKKLLDIKEQPKDILTRVLIHTKIDLL